MPREKHRHVYSSLGLSRARTCECGATVVAVLAPGGVTTAFAAGGAIKWVRSQ